MLLWTLECTHLFELVFWGFCSMFPAVELLCHKVVLVLAFWGSLCPWDSPGKNTGVGCHFLLQGTVYEGSLFSTSSPTFVICVLFDNNHFDRWEMISHMVLICISWWLVMLNIFFHAWKLMLIKGTSSAARVEKYWYKSNSILSEALPPFSLLPSFWGISRRQYVIKQPSGSLLSEWQGDQLSQF